MEVYRVDNDSIMQLDDTTVQAEENLEERLVRTAEATIGGVEIMYIDRQGTVDGGGRFDLTGVDSAGNLVVLELKKGQGSREVIAQALEYASKLRNEQYSRLNQAYLSFIRSELGFSEDDITVLKEAHQECFNRDEPLGEPQFNDDQRIIIIGATFDDATVSMADFLRERGGIDVILVEYNLYRESESGFEVLTTTPIRRPLEVEPTSKSKEGLREKELRRIEFWEDFEKAHQELGLAGRGTNKNASYFIQPPSAIHAAVRPTVSYNSAYNLIRFYDGTRHIPNDKDLRSEFEEAVECQISELDVSLHNGVTDTNRFKWDTNPDRNFDKVRMDHPDSNHNEFNDEETVAEIQEWLLDTSLVFYNALEEFVERDDIEVE